MNILDFLIAIIGSAGFSAIVTHLLTKRKQNAEVMAIQTQAILDMDQRLTEKVTTLEQKVLFLEQENTILKQDIQKIRSQNDIFKQTNATLLEENSILGKQIETLLIENTNLKKENAGLRLQLQKMGD